MSEENPESHRMIVGADGKTTVTTTPRTHAQTFPGEERQTSDLSPEPERGAMATLRRPRTFGGE
jgi:hypothetical protein